MSSRPHGHELDNVLRYHTPIAWAQAALTKPNALLADHAYLERKAAANALELLNRWPMGCEAASEERIDKWVMAMTSVARDEAEHLNTVVRLLARRGGRLPRSHANPYAQALRGLVRMGQGDLELLDRLLVSALIEARSCERFELLAAAAEDGEMARLYRGLGSSERGHYRLFVDLAGQSVGASIADARWDWMLEQEARIIAAQPPGPRMHSGVISN